MIKKCEICGMEFNAARHSSRKCNREHHSKCSVCGKDIILTPSQEQSVLDGRKVTCSKKCRAQVIKDATMKKYGVDNVFKLKYIQDKIKNNNVKLYGCENPFITESFKSKAKDTKIQKYGNENFNNRAKSKKTSIQKYGVDNPCKSDKVKSKISKNIITAKRSLMSDQALYVINNFKQFVLGLSDDNRTLGYLCQYTGLSESYVRGLIHENNLDDSILKQYSLPETDIKAFLDKHDICYIHNTRTIIKPLELDFYIPDYNLAIEYNGLYRHADLGKNYHYNKSKMCEEKGIRLIHIWEHEWNNERQRPILENIILSACNKNMNRVYARKCNIVVKPSSEMRQFYEKNNIQGFRGGKFSICLEYNNEIIMAYNMGSAFFGKGKYEWEVIRGATKLGYTVVGGASKIFNYFIKTYNPQNCVYYIDYNYFNGNSLKNLPNMKFIKSQISFKNWWVKENIVKNREPARNAEIKKLQEKGLVKPLYNAGTKVYLWERKN